MTLDLPTLERPRKAISGRVGSGELGGVGRGRHEAGENPHAQVCNGGREIGKRGTNHKPRRTRSIAKDTLANRVFSAENLPSRKNLRVQREPR